MDITGTGEASCIQSPALNHNRCLFPCLHLHTKHHHKLLPQLLPHPYEKEKIAVSGVDLEGKLLLQQNC